MESNAPIETANPSDLLTPRQTEALHYAALGKTCAEAAYIMSCSERTAKEHITNLYHKFNVHNRAQLIAQAFAKGYLKAGHTFLLLLAISAGISDEPDYRVPRTGTRVSRSQRKQPKTISLDYKIIEAWT